MARCNLLPPLLPIMSKTEYHREWKREKRKSTEFRLRAAEIQRKYYANDVNRKEKALRYRLKTRYGITLEQYQELFDLQEGRCALCNKHQSDLKGRLVVDHDHKSSEIRALLCAYCNLWVVGKLRKDTIQPIHEYLNREYTGWIVPPKKKKRKVRNGKRKRKSVR